MRKNKKKKKVDLTKQLKKKAWKAFSVWIRFRGGKDGFNECISCGKTYAIKTMNAGHYIHGTWRKASGFHEDNVWAQCVYCNLGLAGNSSEYERRLIEKIGIEKVQALRTLSKQIWKPTTTELENLIEKYSKPNAD